MQRRRKARAKADSGQSKDAAPLTEDVWSQHDDAKGAQSGWGSGPCLGIDLGTTNSCVGLWLPQKNRVKIIRNPLGSRTTPSVVSFVTTPPCVGQAALDQASQHPPESTVACAKRVIGRRFDSAQVQGLLSHLPFKPAEGSEGEVQIPVSGDGAPSAHVSPQQVATTVLSELKAYATEYAVRKDLLPVGSAIECAVVGVPAHFTQIQRQATIYAANAAGFKYVKTLSESSAAAMAYGLFVAGRKTAVVVDLGGGTLDVTVMRIDEGKFEVLATGGCATLGGEDFDTQLLLHVLQQSSSNTAGQFEPGSAAQAALRRECCRAKIELSDADETEVVLEASTPGRPESLSVKVTRAEFEEAVAELVARCAAAVFARPFKAAA